jgi:hypothetical protein
MRMSATLGVQMKTLACEAVATTKMYQTLLVHESSTTSQEEKALAEKKLRMPFLFESWR